MQCFWCTSKKPNKKTEEQRPPPPVIQEQGNENHRVEAQEPQQQIVTRPEIVDQEEPAPEINDESVPGDSHPYDFRHVVKMMQKFQMTKSAKSDFQTQPVKQPSNVKNFIEEQQEQVNALVYSEEGGKVVNLKINTPPLKQEINNFIEEQGAQGNPLMYSPQNEKDESRKAIPQLKRASQSDEIYQSSSKAEQMARSTRIVIEVAKEEQMKVEDLFQLTILQLYEREDRPYSMLQSKDQINDYATKFVPIRLNQHSRSELANKDGGKECKNPKLSKAVRLIVQELINGSAKEILKQNVDITSIPLPIDTMVPCSALERVLNSTCMFPYYIRKAAQLSSPLERFKLVIVATLGSFNTNYQFFKPLTSLIGETAEAYYSDGTELFAEQVSPNSTLYQIIGDNYVAHGSYVVHTKPGFNQIEISNRGKRYIQFSDGQSIQYNFAHDHYTGALWNPLKVEAKGSITYLDVDNQISATIDFGNVRFKPSDYFSSEIVKSGKNVSKIYGSYMGFINFDDRRYWDHQRSLPHRLHYAESMLKSDHLKRKDRNLMIYTRLDQAQLEYDQYNTIQMNDIRLRSENKKK